MKTSLILLFLLILNSCGLLEHRDFAQEMGYGQLQYMDEPTFMPNRDFMVVSGDNGRDYRSPRQIDSRTPATAESREERLYNASLERELIVLENALGDAEYNNYLKYRNQLGSTSEKIYFLRLSPREQSQYLNVRGMQAVSNVKSNSYGRSIARTQDVFMGMSRSEVSQSWGRPMLKEVSGDLAEGNERWAYSKNGQIKYIYFEGGRVQGWTTE